MRSFVLSLALGAILSLSGPALADDRSDIQATISAQLGAFRAGDKAAAYGLAAPNIQRLFPSPDVFMRMVETGYEPVYRSSSATFGELRPEGSGFRQEVNLTDAAGVSWIATYTLERQPDGSMKITGCSLRKGDDLSA